MSETGIHRNKKVNPTSQKAYERIGDQLRREIADKYQPGDLLPPQLKLAERFSVHRHTIRRAMDALVEEQVLLRQPGRGTVVLKRPIAYEVKSRPRFTEAVEAMGMSPSSRALAKRVIDADEAVQQALQLEPGAQVVWIEALRLIDEEPVLVTSIYLPADPFAPLAREYQEGSLYRLLKARFGLTPRRGHSSISATMPSTDDARHLQMSPRQPVLCVTSVDVDSRTGEPVQYAVTRYRGDSITLTVKP